MSETLLSLIAALTVVDKNLAEIINRDCYNQPEYSNIFECKYIFDKNYKYLYANIPGSYKIGLQPKDIIGKHWTELNLPPENMNIVENELKEVFCKGISIKNEFFSDHNTAYGRQFFEYILSPIFDESGEVEAVLGILKDITEQKRNKDRYLEEYNKYLNENLKLYQLIELCTAGIVLLDSEGRIEKINQAYCDKFLAGHSVQALIGKHGSELGKIFGLEWSDTLFYSALKGIPVCDQYLQTDKWSVLRSGIPIKNFEGKIVGALAIVYDITGHERLAWEMKKLDRLNIVAEMAAGVAHEIRNPMTVIKGYLQHYQNRCKADCSMHSRIPIILEELARVEGLVTDFLSLANNKATSKECKNLNKIIKAIEPLVTSHALEHGMAVKLVLADDIPDMLLDEKEIRQLVINLARNAIEAMEKHGIVTLQTIAKNSEVLLQVADTGVGIPAENREKIFNPFYTSKNSGTGLGLSICASIVERHNGKITVQSELDVGSCFNVSFPF